MIPQTSTVGRTLRSALALPIFIVTLAACGGSGGEGGGGGGVTEPAPDTKVASVTVSAPKGSLPVAGTMQLTATARNAAGSTLSGRSFSWTSSSDSIAAVSSSGLVSGRSTGSVTIAAAADGKSGSVALSVTPVAVASVTVSPATTSLTVGATQQLTATVEDADGNTLTGRALGWTSSNSAVATVSADGVVTGVAAGTATITATSEGKSGSAAVTVTVPQAARVAITPHFTVIDSGGSAALTAAAYDSAGAVLASPTVSWSTPEASIVSVGEGVVSGSAVGKARVVALVNAATDTAWMAVLGAKSLLSTAFAGDSVKLSVKPGQTLTVPVVLDLSKVSTSGDLGAAELELAYDPSLLTYLSAVAEVQGSADYNVPAAGTFKFSFATTQPQGAARFTLVIVTFQVSANAPVGAESALTLTYTSPPASTGFESYEIPIGIGGRLRVIAP